MPLNGKKIFIYYFNVHYVIKKNENGKWTNIFTNKKRINISVIPQVNKRAWQFAFMIKANRMKIVMRKFIELTKYMNLIKIITFDNFEKIFIKIFGNNWSKDIVDMAYFYELLGVIIDKNENGTIKRIIIKKPITIRNNFNEIINKFFNENIQNINI